MDTDVWRHGSVAALSTDGKIISFTHLPVSDDPTEIFDAEN